MTDRQVNERLDQCINEIQKAMDDGNEHAVYQHLIAYAARCKNLTPVDTHTYSSVTKSGLSVGDKRDLAMLTICALGNTDTPKDDWIDSESQMISFLRKTRGAYSRKISTMKKR